MDTTQELAELTTVKNIEDYLDKKKGYKNFVFNDNPESNEHKVPHTPNSSTIETPKTVTVPVLFFSQLSFTDNGKILGKK